MNHKHTLAKWLGAHILAISTFLVLIFALPLEGCGENYNIPIVNTTKKEGRGPDRNAAKQEEGQDVYLALTDMPTPTSNGLAIDQVESVQTQVPKAHQEHSSQDLFDAVPASNLPLSIPNKPAVDKKNQIVTSTSKQQITQQSSPVSQKKNLQTRQYIASKQRETESLMLEEKKLLAKTFTTSGGYEVSFYKEAEIWKAKVKEVKYGIGYDELGLPIYFDSGKTLAQTIQQLVGMELKTSLIQVVVSPSGKRNEDYVYIGGILGGGRQIGAQKRRKNNVEVELKAGSYARIKELLEDEEITNEERIKLNQANIIEVFLPSPDKDEYGSIELISADNKDSISISPQNVGRLREKIIEILYMLGVSDLDKDIDISRTSDILIATDKVDKEGASYVHISSHTQSLKKGYKGEKEKKRKEETEKEEETQQLKLLPLDSYSHEKIIRLLVGKEILNQQKADGINASTLIQVVLSDEEPFSSVSIIGSDKQSNSYLVKNKNIVRLLREGITSIVSKLDGVPPISLAYNIDVILGDADKDKYGFARISKPIDLSKDDKGKAKTNGEYIGKILIKVSAQEYFEALLNKKGVGQEQKKGNITSSIIPSREVKVLDKDIQLEKEKVRDIVRKRDESKKEAKDLEKGSIKNEELYSLSIEQLRRVILEQKKEIKELKSRKEEDQGDKRFGKSKEVVNSASKLYSLAIGTSASFTEEPMTKLLTLAISGQVAIEFMLALSFFLLANFPSLRRKLLRTEQISEDTRQETIQELIQAILNNVSALSLLIAGSRFIADVSDPDKTWMELTVLGAAMGLMSVILHVYFKFIHPQRS